MPNEDNKEKKRSPSLEFKDIYSMVREKEREKSRGFPSKASQNTKRKAQTDVEFWEGKSKHLPPNIDRDFHSFGNSRQVSKDSPRQKSSSSETTKSNTSSRNYTQNRSREQERRSQNAPRIGYEDKPRKSNSKTTQRKVKPKPKRELRPEAKRFFLGMFVVIGVFTTLMIVIFTVFKIKAINVVGESPYTVQEIIDKAGIENGDNLLFVSSGKIESSLMKEFPYIKSVSLRKNLPGTLQIEIIPLEITTSIESEGLWLYTSTNGKIAGSASNPVEESVKVRGLPTENKQPGEYIEITDENAKMAYLEVMSTVIEHGSLAKCKGIDLTDIYNITLNYENRITIKIGNVSDLSYKVGYALDLIEKGQIGEDEKGTLDVSTAKENGRGIFSPENGAANSYTQPN